MLDKASKVEINVVRVSAYAAPMFSQVTNDQVFPERVIR